MEKVYVPSNVPKFKYKNLHKRFRECVYQYYKPLDRISYRIVSEDCDEKDFIPVVTTAIESEEINKLHIDQRSLSFFTNIDACMYKAVNIYRDKLRRKGEEAANKYRNEKTHVALVPLTKEDGFMEEVPTGFHFNFAPFEKFKIGKYELTPIDYNLDEMYYLQIEDDKPIAILSFMNDGNCFLSITNENLNHIPIIFKVSVVDVVRYMRKKITLKKLCSLYNKEISSNLAMYKYYDSKYVIDEEDIVLRLYDTIEESNNFRERIYRAFCFRTPVLKS